MQTDIPLWIDLLQIVILAILSRQAFNCYFHPEKIYPEITGAPARKVVYVLAGRNTVMVVISFLALVWQNPAFLCFAFLMHSLRESQDMFIIPLTNPPGSRVKVFFIFLIVFVIPEILAVVTLYQRIG